VRVCVVARLLALPFPWHSRRCVVVALRLPLLLLLPLRLTLPLLLSLGVQL
jgi:hypothetical protein